MQKTQIIDGKAIAQNSLLSLKSKLAALSNSRKPCLATVLVGEDPASQVYVRNKRRQAENVGMVSRHHQLPEQTSERELLELIQQLNQDEDVDGILVQLPLPSHMNARSVIEHIHPEKDVDGFHPENVGLLQTGHPRFAPCTPLGCMTLLRHYGIATKGQHAVVVGRSNIVGRPMAALLLNADATVTITHRYTEHLSEFTQQADILITAVGKPHLLSANDIKEGAVVLDVGINRLPDGSLVGDVDQAAVMGKASAISPVPGGVGPMTIAMLLHNTLKAFKARTPGVSP